MSGNLEVKEKKKAFEPTHEQILAIEHTGSDLLISAGAGSGKTATLTDRIITQICKQNMDISRMLVVTYTKEAALELKARISKKLSAKLKENPSSKHISSQLIKVTSADISTIHSFCLKCIRPNFDKLGIDSDFRIGEESELMVLRSEAMNEVIDGFFEADEIDKDFLAVSNCFSDYTNEDTLPKNLLTLYSDLISTSKGIELLTDGTSVTDEFLDSKYGTVLVNHIRRIVNHFKPVVTELIDVICSEEKAQMKFYATYKELNDILQRLDNQLSHPKYEQISQILNDYQAIGFTRHALPTGFDAEMIVTIRDELKDELIDLRSKYFCSSHKAVLSAISQNARSCMAIYRVLKEFDKCYKAKKKRHGVCDFNDLERYTLELFYDENGEISSIAKEIGKNYDQLYIDEYQDNNSVQDKIFLAISRNNRFMVGDIKQSIYSFRSAEPELFSYYRDTFVPYTDKEYTGSDGRTLFMSDNFRCDLSVIKTANDISDYMFSNSSGFKYVSGDRLKHSKLYEKEQATLPTALCLIDKSKVEKDSYFAEVNPQAEFVAQKIKDLIDNGYLPNGEKIEPRHIAILLKAKKNHADKYIDALNRYGINNEYSQKINFFEKSHILLMLCILNAIDNPANDIYLTGAMHSRVFGFSLEELITVKASCDKEYSLYSALKGFNKETELGEKITDFLSRLDDMRKRIGKMSAENAISYIMSELGFMSGCGKDERADIIKLYNIARGYEKGSYKGLYSFLRYVDEIAKSPMVETVSSDTQNSVKITTMHSSKGLEYEICFLCDLESPFSAKSYTGNLLFDKELGVCGCIGSDESIVKYDNLVRKCCALSIKARQREEAMRLLYVAMTRARSQLYMVATLSKIDTHKNYALLMKNLVSEYAIYSKSNHISMALGSCFFENDYVEELHIDPNTLLTKDENESLEENGAIGSYAEYKELLKERFEYRYPYETETLLPSKLSISKLYPTILDEEEEMGDVAVSIDDVPDFILAEKDKVTGAQIGIATHVFLQFCNFEALVQNGVKAELERLVSNSFISREVGEIINLDYIEKFRASELLKEMLNAKSIKREFRFNVLISASELSKNPLLSEESVLVQGVTDCVFENEKGELILVDYKTDKVTIGNYKERLKELHSSQLYYYKLAIEKIYSRELSKVLIYSVPLGKTVELD